MALPKVTPGTYNYGQYASPTQVKYNAAGDLALAEGIAKGIESLGDLAKTKIEQRLELDAKINESQENALNNLAVEQQKEKEKQNESKINTLTDLANRAGSLLTAKQRREYKRGIRTGDEDLTRRESRQALDKELGIINNEVDAFIALNKYDMDEDLLNSTDPQSISADSLPNFNLAKQLANGNYGTVSEGGRTYVTYKYIGTDGKEKEGKKLLTDLVENIEQYTEFDPAFRFGNSEEFNKMAEAKGKSFGQNRLKALYTEEIGGVKYINRDKVKEQMLEGDFMSSLVDTFGYKAIQDIGDINNVEEFKDRAVDYIIDNYITQTGADVVKPNALEWAELRLEQDKLRSSRESKYKKDIAEARRDLSVLDSNIKSIESTEFIANLKSLASDTVKDKGPIDSKFRNLMNKSNFSLEKAVDLETEEFIGYKAKHPLLGEFNFTFNELDDGSFVDMLLTKLRTKKESIEGYIKGLSPTPPPPPKD